MKLAASLTATGILGFLLLEALKILLAPVATWLLGAVIIAVKFLAVGTVLVTAIVVSVFVFRRLNRSRSEA